MYFHLPATQLNTNKLETQQVPEEHRSSAAEVAVPASGSRGAAGRRSGRGIPVPEPGSARTAGSGRGTPRGAIRGHQLVLTYFFLSTTTYMYFEFVFDDVAIAIWSTD